MSHPVVKDVQDELLSSRKHKRRSGEVPYPLEYTHDMVDYDNWSHMYMDNLYEAPSLFNFDTPPARCLDLGCGGGWWIMNAAKKWKESTFVGLDIRDIQPKLHTIEGYEHIARRVQWVQSNLLEPLPFPDEHFDYARLRGIGLGVPEDEWQDVLDEINRVLRPGGVVEVIEDDLIFPCGPPPRPQMPLTSQYLPVSNSNSTSASIPNLAASQSTRSLARSISTARSSTLCDLKTPVSEDAPSILEKASVHTSSNNSNNSHSDSNMSLPLDYLKLPSPRIPEPPTDAVNNDFVHPQDHTKIKTAWEEMLHARFLAPQPLSILPFYLSSSAYTDVQLYPPMQIPLPPNSKSAADEVATPPIKQRTEASIDLSRIFEYREQARGKTKADSGGSRQPASHATVLGCAAMHLMRNVRMIQGCKEVIWEQYEKLYQDEPTVQPVMARPNRNTCRDEFEQLWSNWENDMMDRAGMRERLHSSLGWGEPYNDLERPAWKVWRDGVSSVEAMTGISEATSSEALEDDNDTASETSSGDGEHARVVRAFLARKPVPKRPKPRTMKSSDKIQTVKGAAAS